MLGAGLFVWQNWFWNRLIWSRLVLELFDCSLTMHTFTTQTFKMNYSIGDKHLTKCHRLSWFPKVFFFTALMHVAFLQVAILQSELLSQDSVDPNSNNFRPFVDDSDADYWLTNMLGYHKLNSQELAWATGLTREEIGKRYTKFRKGADLKVAYPRDRLLLLPYPGGRHPRIGFLDGALRPQRETKISVFLPWDPKNSYVVVDVPEAIWSNLGLTYLAHTHIPTVFDKQKKRIQQMEWDRSKSGELYLKRVLPNKIEFTSRVTSHKNHVRMSMTLSNGTDAYLTDLRVQNCVMLKAAKDFNQQTNDNKRFIGPYVVCHNSSKNKWILTAWKPVHRPWANPPCPCLHSDPKFPDCAPGEMQKLEGWLSFYEGQDIDGEVKRIEKLKWWDQTPK